MGQPDGDTSPSFQGCAVHPLGDAVFIAPFTPSFAPGDVVPTPTSPPLGFK